MSPIAAAWGVLLLTVATQARPECPPAATEAIGAASRDAASGAYRAAAERLRTAAGTDAACVALSVAAWSSQGWIAALAAADAGGTDDALADARGALGVLATLGGPASPAAYAAALLHAAAAAAQDERDEMALWLDHARDLGRRLDAAGTPAEWPQPFDLAEAELWLNLDDFELAELAFARALARDDSTAGWFGLARARAGRGDAAGACHAYARVATRKDVAPDVTAATARARERCPK